MVDTGMTRSGVASTTSTTLLQQDRVPPVAAAGRALHALRQRRGRRQPVHRRAARGFRDATDAAPQVAARARSVRHAANSGAIFFTPQSHLDMVRPGHQPVRHRPDRQARRIDRPLRPVMRWTAPLVGVRDDAPRAPASATARRGQADRDTRIGLVPVGYADGYPRAYSNRARGASSTAAPRPGRRPGQHGPDDDRPRPTCPARRSATR